MESIHLFEYHYFQVHLMSILLNIQNARVLIKQNFFSLEIRLRNTTLSAVAKL